MDFMKVFDQTVREIKREVNIKVLKVPEIEQKVFDATSNEPWGPHGTALAEIAKATKRFTECQLVMNVLWTRLKDSSQNWRHVYKALVVMEYLVANGSERAVDDIIERGFQISSLSGFEYVEPNGKDMGINVRKKAETILALLNNKDKIQEVRNKAAANRDKYIGLSSSGITYKPTPASYGSTSFQSSDRNGGLSGTNNDMFKDGYKDKESSKDGPDKLHRGAASDNEENKLKKGSSRYGSRDQVALSSNSSRVSKKSNSSDDNYGAIPSLTSSAHLNNPEEDDDDFNPRATSNTGSAAASTSQVDLFGNLMDAPTSIPTKMTTASNATSEVDLFADATFASVPPHVEAGASSQTPANVDLFASQPAISSTTSSTVNYFALSDPLPQTETNSQKSEPLKSNTIDPFAAVPLNCFDGSDLFGAFTVRTDPVSTDSTQNSANDDSLNNVDQESLTDSKLPAKETFQVKSGIWADSLSRGLIDLNISAPKKISLADIGIVGGLSDGSDEKGPSISVHMGKAMTAGSAPGRSEFTSSTARGGNGTFPNLNQQQQFGCFKK